MRYAISSLSFPLISLSSFQSQSTYIHTYIHTIQRPLTLSSLPQRRRVIYLTAIGCLCPHTQLPHRQQSNCRPSTQQPTTTIPDLPHSPWTPDANTTSHRHEHRRANQPRCLAELSTSSLPPPPSIPSAAPLATMSATSCSTSPRTPRTAHAAQTPSTST